MSFQIFKGLISLPELKRQDFLVANYYQYMFTQQVINFLHRPLIYAVKVQLSLYQTVNVQIIIMNVFNQHKIELIAEINRKIDMTDRACSKISRNIHQYSQKMLQNLKSQKDEVSKDLQTKKLVNKQQSSLIADLIKELEFQKQEQDSLLADLKKKEQYEVSLRKDLLFLQQKIEEEQPHFKSYLSQNEKCKKANGKVQYAKNKLKQLELKYKKHCQEVQYKYKLVQLMKETLKQRQQRNKQSIRETSRIENEKNSAFSCYINQNAEEGMEKETDLSQNTIEAALRHFSS